MPNHIQNRLTILDNPERVKTIREAMKGENGLLDFNNFIPYPKKYKDLDKAAHDFNEANPGKWGEAPKDGFNQGGYEWCNSNWGTKWNAYDLDRPDNTPDGAVLYFQTAWGTPHLVIRVLANRFPETTFKLEWADEDSGHNTGEITFSEGDAEVNEPEGNSPEAWELYFSLHDDREMFEECEGGGFRYKEE